MLTPPEARLWIYLRGRKIAGLKFRRQHPVGSYVLDFYCAEVKLAVEVDGRGHEHPDQGRIDQVRTAWLATQGVRWSGWPRRMFGSIWRGSWGI